MKIITALLVVVALAAAEYTDIPNDASFYEGLMANKDALKSLFGCLLDESPCDEFGTHAKGHMVESIKNGCKDCGPLQKHFTRLIEEMAKSPEYKEYFDKLMAKYDPEGVYIVKLEKNIAGY